MKLSPHLLGLAVAAALVLPVVPALAAATHDCPVPSDLIAAAPKLPLTSAKLRRNQPLTIVAIGGASTAGIRAGDGAIYSYPHRLEEALRRRHPGLAVTVINKGVPRQTTQDMVARFANDVVPLKPSLVLWETGTVDAVRGIEIDNFAAALQDGIAALRRHNFDVILIDMQYNRNTGSVIDFGPYLEALHDAADFDEVYLFRRYAIMRAWSENAVFDYVDVQKGGRMALAQEVYRCLGEALADAIGRATH